MNWNEDQFSADVSSYRLEWLALPGAPGIVLVRCFDQTDPQLGDDRDIVSIAVLNGVCYLLAALTIRTLWVMIRKLPK